MSRPAEDTIRPAFIGQLVIVGEVGKRKVAAQRKGSARYLRRGSVHRIEDLAHSAGARRVTRAKIWLGALSHLSAGHFREHFSCDRQVARMFQRFHHR